MMSHRSPKWAKAHLVWVIFVLTKMIENVMTCLSYNLTQIILKVLVPGYMEYFNYTHAIFMHHQ